MKSVITPLLAAGLLVTFGAAGAPAPIALAIFDFELEDFSPTEATESIAPADAAHLAKVTRTVRQLLAESGRYKLIDVASADAPAAKTHTLRDCDGCEAEIALKLGAQQSLVGVVSRISRTEYVVRFHVRDARTGAVVANGDSGLRMGADYSWDRGAASLLKDQLLATAPKR
ncbi:DUF3280 domain-containing protein [Steroidobacter sp. S1-65]|uniref:DUF3280 domain-containing protein n=1 Tax=Steroidobacter gossypii TaxID=2805490 RepID=A0ABS1X3K5_9GAMM|nr:DUF3280 domain-containing protein [Steroidobacter gossypii]MBM0107801.1 DUF3280 domain-containing protein [Steroidobacter gossypii]